jgi:hypothetical protein
VVELLQTPGFPNCEFGLCGPDALRLLNEDLLYAENGEQIEDAINSLVEARDALNRLIENSSVEATFFCALEEEVKALEDEEKEELTKEELQALIKKHAESLAQARKTSSKKAEAEVRSWFALEGGDL